VTAEFIQYRQWIKLMKPTGKPRAFNTSIIHPCKTDGKAEAKSKKAKRAMWWLW